MQKIVALPPRPRRHGAAIALALVVPMAVALLAGCAAEAPDPAGPPTVVATTNLVADTARRLAGDDLVVEALMGPGVDPHLYKASEGDVRRLDRANLILYTGLQLEGKMGDILDKMGRTRPVVPVAEVLPESRLLAPESYAGAFDPHVWHDVSRWSATVPTVADALVGLAPEHEEAIRARAAAYRDELAALDEEVRRRLGTLPPEHRILVTAHDAFAYFGEAYDIEVVGIQGISTVSEAGLADIERVVELMAERRVPALFVESSVPRRTVEAVQQAVAERGHQVAIGGELYSDALGAADGPAGDYVGMIRSNIDTIVTALGGEPETRADG